MERYIIKDKLKALLGIRSIYREENGNLVMTILDQVQNRRGSEAALGMVFSGRTEYGSKLPSGSRLIGQAGNKLLCYVQGYQETVFAVDIHSGIAKPLAYDFSEFLRLVFACGSAERAASIAFVYGNVPQGPLVSAPVSMKRLREYLGLTPISDPVEYVKTVGQVIDCSRLRA